MDKRTFEAMVRETTNEWKRDGIEVQFGCPECGDSYSCEICSDAEWFELDSDKLVLFLHEIDLTRNEGFGK